MLLTKKIITRKEYMENSSELYESYYYQFITPSIMKFVRENYTKEIAEKYKESIKPETYQSLINYEVKITD